MAQYYNMFRLRSVRKILFINSKFYVLNGAQGPGYLCHAKIVENHPSTAALYDICQHFWDFPRFNYPPKISPCNVHDSALFNNFLCHAR